EVMKRDLRAPHFKPDEKRRLSDQLMDQYTSAQWVPKTSPSGGFFRIYSPSVFLEGVDGDRIQATRAVNHQLHFTSILQGGTDQTSQLGDDILLSNVLSFEVRPSWVGTPAPRPYAPGTPTTGSDTGSTTTDHPFDTLPASNNPSVPSYTFDTAPNAPLMVRVKVIQIKLRVWDPKMKAARQLTFVL